jgi:hypothetical protein
MISHSPSAVSLPLRTPPAVECQPVLPPATVEPRFTLDGTSELEQHLALTCRKIAAGLGGLIPRSKLEAVLLGGGYGRGEGGVLRTATGARPYNDLEFYVCLRGNRHLNERRFGRAIHVLGEILTPQAGVEVEFKITSLRELSRSSVSMFSYDLVQGHRWLIGDDRLFAGCGHHRDAERIPIAEATRLLMNRCSGLLLAAERLEQRDFGFADADFVRRNIAKAELALGDAVLVTRHLYHWSVRERHRRLELLQRTDATPWLDEVRRHHGAGVEFKLHPEQSTASRETLAAAHAQVAEIAGRVWLWLEQQRMSARFETPRDYAESALNKFRESSRRRNVFLNLRALGIRPLIERRGTRHPRERILNALALLLWDRAAVGTPEILRIVQRELQTSATNYPGLMRAYRQLWTRVN